MGLLKQSNQTIHLREIQLSLPWKQYHVNIWLLNLATHSIMYGTKYE